MTIEEERRDGVAVLAPSGRIDTTTVMELDQRLDPLLAQPRPRIVVDLAGIEYISSAGLRVLLVAARRVQTGNGALALCCMRDAVHQVFRLAGFLPLFTIRDTREAALQATTVR